MDRSQPTFLFFFLKMRGRGGTKAEWQDHTLLQEELIPLWHCTPGAACVCVNTGVYSMWFVTDNSGQDASYLPHRGYLMLHSFRGRDYHWAYLNNPAVGSTPAKVTHQVSLGLILTALDTYKGVLQALNGSAASVIIASVTVEVDSKPAEHFLLNRNMLFKLYVHLFVSTFFLASCL